VVLRDGGEPLVEEIFEAVVIGLDDKSPPLEVWPPMPHGEHQVDELTLVRRERPMPWRHWSAEEGDRVALLDKHSPKPVGGCVALDDERLGEVWQR
jgi:hypothetical protein